MRSDIGVANDGHRAPKSEKQLTQVCRHQEAEIKRLNEFKFSNATARVLLCGVFCGLVSDALMLSTSKDRP